MRQPARGRGERGAALVELALMVPVLTLLFAGIAALGDALNAYLSVVNASRDGARLAARAGAGDAEIRSLVLADLRRLRDPSSDSDITITRNVIPGEASIQVRVCHSHRLIISYPLLGIPDPLRLCAATTMRLTG
jgi:Flp pilus assembly protein TadG